MPSALMVARTYRATDAARRRRAGGTRRLLSAPAMPAFRRSIGATAERVDARAGRRGRATRGRRAGRARRAARARVSPRGATRSTAAASPPTISAVSSIRARHPLARVGVLEEDRRERREARGALPADDLVVVDLGQLGGERRHLRVLVELALPAVRGGGGQPGAGDHRHRLVQGARDALGVAVLGPVRAPLVGERARERRRAPRPPSAATARSPHAPRPPARRRTVADRGARLEAAGERDRPGTPSRRAPRGQLAAARAHHARRAGRARRVVGGRASPRCCPSSSSRARACPGPSRRQAVAARQLAAAAPARRRSAARASAPPTPTRPCRRRRARRQSQPAAAPPASTRHSASRR